MKYHKCFCQVRKNIRVFVITTCIQHCTGKGTKTRYKVQKGGSEQAKHVIHRYCSFLHQTLLQIDSIKLIAFQCIRNYLKKIQFKIKIKQK